LPLARQGSLDERRQARLGAAELTLRNGGTPEDLKHLLDVLQLWPSQDLTAG